MYQKFFVLLLLLSSFLFAEIGLAGWYGKEFQGQITSSGEKFNMHDYTAAHKTLPLNTIVKVTNLKNGKSVNVRINDRNPKRSNRVIDLSYQSAQAIGLVNLGTSKVRLEIKKLKKVTLPYTLHHVPASKEEVASMREYALQMLSTSTKMTRAKNVSPNSKKVVKLQVGSFATKEAAHAFILKEKSKGYQMQTISYFSSKFNTFRHKVVILCNSIGMAHNIIKSKSYKGAYIIR
jgi:rare lipoprotein A